MAMAGDPDIVSDFLVPLNATKVGGTVFTFTVGAPLPTAFTVSKVSAAEFPAGIGQSVSCAVLQFPAGTTNPPHTHPRSTEVLFLVDDSLQVGFVDTLQGGGACSLPIQGRCSRTSFGNFCLRER